MDETRVAALARAAGLDVALRDFPDDVAIAIMQAGLQAQGVLFPTDPAAEPWPPMQAKAAP